MAGPTPNSVLAAGSQPWVQSACDWEAERWQGCPVQPDLWGICGARGAVRSRDVWGLLSANMTYFPRLRGLVASRRGTSGTFPRDFLPPV